MLLEEQVIERFSKKQWTLALAESCTGGALSSKLTLIAGASACFAGAFIAYSNEFKKNILHVTERTLLEEGAVSAKCAEEMLQGVFSNTGADFAIAVTGIAGPSGGTPQKPVGTIWCSIGEKNSIPVTWMHKAQGTRKEIILSVCDILLTRLWEYSHKF